MMIDELRMGSRKYSSQDDWDIVAYLVINGKVGIDERLSYIIYILNNGIRVIS